MILSRSTLQNIPFGNVALPPESLFELPEKVLQFGTGVLLRGLPDYFIDKANRRGLFNGRIVVVKSTAQGDTSAFDRQDCLYTLCVRGLREGKAVEENIINASISRVLNAATDWPQVLACAHDPNIRVVVSNTTEVGIELVKEDILRHPPASYPAKLLAFLYERFRAFGGSAHSGVVIIPTELIPDNGRRLESIVLELAHLNGLEDRFIEWLERSNHFCNSLVDRIVPGTPDAAVLRELDAELGYRDQLLEVCEEYRLWAIEGGEPVRQVLSFAPCDEGVIIAPDIELYRELKLRLLNGTHTLSCGLAFLAGCDTVREAMEDPQVGGFISAVMLQEIAPAIPGAVDPAAARAFGERVLERFRNPHIRHKWINITMQYSSKMKLRCVPVLMKHYRRQGSVPELFALGFAAYLRFLKPVKRAGEQYYGEYNGVEYLIQDDLAAQFYRRWSTLPVEDLVRDVLGDKAFWGEDLLALPGFEQSVTARLQLIIQQGARKCLEGCAP